MNKIKPLGKGLSIGAHATSRATKLQIKSDSKCSILDMLMDFARSVPDFRRTGKGHIRHRLSDIIVLMIFARMSKCLARADIIEFGRRNLNKFHSMGLLKNEVPSEATLFRIESGIDNEGLARRMAEFMEMFNAEFLMHKSDVPEIIRVDGKAMRGTVQENGRNPDIVSAHSYTTGITLATEASRGIYRKELLTRFYLRESLELQPTFFAVSPIKALQHTPTNSHDRLHIAPKTTFQAYMTDLL